MRRAKKTLVITLLSVLIFVATTIPVYIAYARRTFTITASVVGGSGTIDPGTTEVNNNQDQTFNIAPDSGYHIYSLMIDGNEHILDIYGNATYTFTRVKREHTIDVNFTENADVELPPGSTIKINILVWDDYTNLLLPGFEYIPGVGAKMPYFEVVIVEPGTITGTIKVAIHYDDSGLDETEEENLRLYVGSPVDFNADGSVNGNDIALIQKEQTSDNPDLSTFDLNNNGEVDSFDENIVKDYANSGLIVNPGQDNAGEFRIPWIDITTELDTYNNMIYGEYWHLSLFGIR